MWTLTKQFRFEASHQLLNHDGKCARLHGHSWVGRVSVRGDSLQREGPRAGMLVDYGDLSAAVKPLVDEILDHHHLNDTLRPYGIVHPTSEEVAQWVFKALQKRLPGIVSVAIEETCTSACVYTEAS